MVKSSKSKAGSAIKHSNKRYSKLQKRGKIKKLSKTSSPLKGLNRGASSGRIPAPVLRNRKQALKNDGSHEGNNVDMYEAEDDDNEEADQDEDGVQDMLDQDEEEDSDDAFHRSSGDDLGQSIPEYEKRGRVFDVYPVGGPVKDMLPIKNRSGVVRVTVPFDKEYEEDKSKSDKEEEDHEIMSKMSDILQSYGSCSVVELFFLRQKRLQNIKLKIAQLANSIIENPQEKINSLKELRLMLDVDDPLICVTLQKLVMVSLLEVFKDIIPGYRIRSTSESETPLKLKKDTMNLHDFENGLINNYKAYLMKLESATAVLSTRRKKKSRSGRKDEQTSVKVPVKAEEKLAEVAVQCLCDLLVAHPHFNFRSNIIVTLVRFTCCDNDAVSDLCCKTLRTVYRRDKLGDLSLEGVKQTVKLLKSKSFSVPPKVLDTFLSLKIKDVKLEEGEDSQKKNDAKKNGRATSKMMSRRDLKRKKKMEKLETELLETAGEESKQKKIGFQTDIVKQVFLIYFRVLKTAPSSILMSAVLEGLAKFSHLINVDFFDDLVVVLHNLIESGNLNYRQCLHCVQTVVTILSGQGEALNIDPLRFYTHLYRILFALHAGASSEDVPVALTCLDIMINNRRKKVSYQRVVAFTKRLFILALQLRHDGAIGVLALARNFMQNHKRVDILLDTDTSQAAGVYLAELEEPEYCNASSTAIWELHYLRRHYHPIVQKLALNLGIGAPVVGNGRLSQDLSRRSATELFQDFHVDDEFKPPPPKPAPKKLSKQKAKALLSHWSALDREIRSALDKFQEELKEGVDQRLVEFDSILRK